MTPEEIKALQDKVDAAEAEKKKLQEEIENLKKPTPEPKPDDEDLKAKAEKERKAKDEEKARTSRMEKAIAFNHTLKDFVKNNKGLIPDEIEGIVAQAEKESYDSASAKAGAVKAGIIQSFFALKDNVELLSAAQKAQLDEFLKFTKNVKEERAETLYDNVLEPALEILKRVKKAKELALSEQGINPGNGVEDAYVKKIVKFSRAGYFGEKETA